jgi:hypothetical protein
VRILCYCPGIYSGGRYKQELAIISGQLKILCDWLNPRRREVNIMGKNEKTSAKVASKAGKILSDPNSTKKEKSVAASALTQARDKPKKK